MSKWLRRGAVSALSIYLLLLALLWAAQERLLFRPTVLPAAHAFAFGADVHETWLDVPGARLNVLHLKRPAPDGVVFFLHGNASSLQRWFSVADFYRASNLDLVMIDYRGYGKSSGRIESEAQLMDDVRAAWHAFAPAYAGKRRIVYGRSLGSGLAAQLAAEVQPDLTVLVSPYESMQVLQHEIYPWVPGVLLRYPLRTDLALPKIHGPVLMLHGDHDTLIPVDHARRLKRASPVVQLVEIPGAGHSDIQEQPLYLEALRRAYSAPQGSADRPHYSASQSSAPKCSEEPCAGTALRPHYLASQSSASKCSEEPCAGTALRPHLVPKILSPASPSPGMM